jgi:tripartite-type tricarboxylate transporter receptor subunit TctC
MKTPVTGILVFAAAMSAGSAFAQKQEPAAVYPQRPIRVIVGFPPGGATDIFARILAGHLNTSWGQQVVVDNRGGATGTVGAAIAARSNPDGYTLMMVPSGPFTISASTYENLPYDAVKDFAAIALLAWVTNVVVVNSASPANSLQDLVKMAKDKPGQVTHGSSGSGSLHHLAGEVLKKLTGTKMVHVPFKGAGPMLIALAGNEITFAFTSGPSAMPFIQNKRLKALAVTSKTRAPALPQTPTLAEAGMQVPAGLEMREWYGMLAPARTPSAIVDKLNAEFVRIFKQPEVQARLTEMGAEFAGSSPAELQSRLATDVKTWAVVVKEAGVRAD